MDRYYAVVLMIALCGLLSSCKPKPISGQVFVATQAGLNSPLGAVQVEVIIAKDANDFMQRRKAEIEGKARSLEEAYHEAKTNYDAAALIESQAQTAAATAETDGSYTNDPEYAALARQNAEDLNAIEMLTKDVQEIHSKYDSYGYYPDFLVPANRQKALDAENAINQDMAWSRSLQYSTNELSAKLEATKNTFLSRLSQAHSEAADTLAQAQAELNDAAVALKAFPTVKDYFDGFAPAPIETTVTDAKGKFTIQKSKRGIKIFVMAQRVTLDSVENYFWLVDLPARGEKLILSNNNMFAIPAASR